MLITTCSANIFTYLIWYCNVNHFNLSFSVGMHGRPYVTRLFYHCRWGQNKHQQQKFTVHAHKKYTRSDNHPIIGGWSDSASHLHACSYITKNVLTRLTKQFKGWQPLVPVYPKYWYIREKEQVCMYCHHL